MLIKILFVVVALLFISAFWVVRRYCVDDRFKILRFASVGFLFAAAGLVLSVVGLVSIAIFVIMIGVMIFGGGAVLQFMRAIGTRLPPPKKWDD